MKVDGKKIKFKMCDIVSLTNSLLNGQIQMRKTELYCILLQNYIFCRIILKTIFKIPITNAKSISNQLKV